MKHRLGGVLFLSLILAGCASVAPEDSEKLPEEVSTTSKQITEEEFRQLPKDLQIEELEARDDTAVVIRSGDRRTIKEYRIGGFLYAIQVIPKVGPPYMLIAADHQGNFIRQGQPGILVPSWTIFEWK